MIDRRLFGISAGLALAVGLPALAASEREEVEKVERAWSEAFDRHDAKALAALYTEDALLLPPPPPATRAEARGRAAIERVWDGVFKAGVLNNQFELIEAEGDQRGIVAAARWASKMRDGAAEKDIGGFTIQVFKREPSGLALWRHIWN